MSCCKLRPKLQEIILRNSVAKTIEEAVREWTELGEYQEHVSIDCLCGKENLTHYFSIVNVKNGNMLDPIGSSCILHFADTELVDKMKIYQHKNFIFNNKGGKNDGKTFDWICKNDENYIKFLISARTNKKRYERLTTYYLTTKKSIKFITPVINEIENDGVSSDDDNNHNTICLKCYANKPKNPYKFCYQCSVADKLNNCEVCNKPTNYRLCWTCKEQGL